MLRNYLKIALRNLKRNPIFSTINITGLAIGMACCLLIFLFVRLEISYDTFHEDHKQMFRVVTDITQGGQTRELAWSSPPLAGALEESFPEIKRAVRIFQQGGTLRHGEEQTVVNVNFVDSDFLAMFDFKLARGNREKALSTPGTIVLSREEADQLFGDQDPMNQVITYEGQTDLTVTGILDNIPPNSHFSPRYLANLQTLPQQRFQQWQGMNVWTYLQLNEDANPENLQSKFPEFVKSTLGEGWARIMTLQLQPLTSIYFQSDRLPEIGPTGDPAYAYIFSAIGIIVLLLAGINFMNLSTAQSIRRAPEVGIRKVLGVHKSQLVRQFLGESLLLTALAMVLATLFTIAALPLFADLSGYHLTSAMLLQPEIIVTMLIITLIVGLSSGSYPAFILSMFKPVAVLKGGRSQGENMQLGRMLSKGLVVFQFSISITLIIATWLISNQLDFIQDKNLGFNKEHVVVVRLNEAMRNDYGSLKQQLLNRSGVIGVGVSSQVPGIPVPPNGYRPETMDEGELLTNTLRVGTDYLDVMKIPFVAGHGFSQDRPSELEQGIILNEAAIPHFNWTSPEEALGRTIEVIGRNGYTGTVIGIVKNFNYASLHNRVEPLVIRHRGWQNFVSVRLAGGSPSGSLEMIEEQWKAIVPGEPFVSWFLNDRLQNLYENETRMLELFGYLSGFAILIAVLGLFGLASFSIRRRTKEIGIRKVLGASVKRIVVMLSKEYLLLLLLASLIASPLAYVFLSRWLSNFAYQVSISVWIFLGASLLVILIALTTVGFHSVKAASMNPVDSLNDE